MKRFDSEVIAGETCDELIETLEHYMRAGWKPVLDPVYGAVDDPNTDGTVTRREVYFQRVMKLA